MAVSEALDALRTLRVAVSLQTARIIDAGRSGFEELGLLVSVQTLAIGLDLKTFSAC